MSDFDINQFKIESEPFYEAQSNEAELYTAAYNARLPVMVKGPTGCGKSRFIEHMAYKLGKPIITVSCNEDITASDLIGRYLLDANGTRWVDGPLTLAARHGAICYLDEIVKAHPDFQLVISYNPGYQSLMKDLKQSTKQRFTGMDFDYASAELEASIVVKESGVDADTAAKLVKLAEATRNLVGHGLDEGASTRLLNYAGTLIAAGVDIKDACHMALVCPITDDSEVRTTMGGAIDAIFG